MGIRSINALIRLLLQQTFKHQRGSTCEGLLIVLRVYKRAELKQTNLKRLTYSASA